MDCAANKARCFSLSPKDATNDGFVIDAGTLNGTEAYRIDCNWMALPDDLHLETGFISTGVGEHTEWSQQIYFSQSFASAPKIVVWFHEFEWLEMGFMSLSTTVDFVTRNGFSLKVRSWAGRNYRGVRVQYLAYPSEEDGKRVKSGRSRVQRAQAAVNNRQEFYGKPFSKVPATFIAICEMDFNSSKNLRFQCATSAPNNSELIWSCGIWADTDMDHAEVQWIAIE